MKNNKKQPSLKQRKAEVVDEEFKFKPGKLNPGFKKEALTNARKNKKNKKDK